MNSDETKEENNVDIVVQQQQQQQQQQQHRLGDDDDNDVTEASTTTKPKEDATADNDDGDDAIDSSSSSKSDEEVGLLAKTTTTTTVEVDVETMMMHDIVTRSLDNDVVAMQHEQENENENDDILNNNKNNKQTASTTGTATEQSQGHQETIHNPLHDVPTTTPGGFVYLFTSIQQFQTTIQQQQQLQQQQSQSQPIYWLILLYDETCSYSSTLLKTVEGAASALRGEKYNNNNKYIPIYTGRVMIDPILERNDLMQYLGIASTPTLLLVSVVSSLSSSSSYLVEYTGKYTTSMDIVRGVQHYFDTLSLTTTTTEQQEENADHTVVVNNDGTTDAQQQQQDESSKQQPQQQHPLLSKLQPRKFPSMQALQLFLQEHSNRLFHHDMTQSRPIMSLRTSTPTERYYANWLFGHDDNENDFDDPTTKRTVVIPPSSLVVIQCRQQQQKQSTDPVAQDQQDRDLDDIDHRTFHDDDSQKHPTATAAQQYYSEFDTMARTLQGRQDRRFWIIESSTECPLGNGSVEAYDIPINYNLATTLALPVESWRSKLTYFKYATNTDDNNNNDTSSTVNSNKDDERHAKKEPSRLVEFLIKICTDPVMWFDQQMIAPIAFSTFRKVHAVLVVDMHPHVLSVVDQALETKQQKLNIKWSFLGTYQSPPPRTVTNVNTHLERHPRTGANLVAVSQFQRICRDYRKESSEWIMEDTNMVCLVVPSTETRILTTLGITDLWYQADAATMHSNNDDPPLAALPALLITDQRFGGTLRYYTNLNHPTEEVEERLHWFMTRYWNEELQFITKSSTKGARTNEAGVRIITADTVDAELYDDKSAAADDADALSSSTSSSRRHHALLLFIAPTCGHCKRLLVLWNQLSRFIRHIGWDTFLQLYQIDVTENDIATTSLNINVEWIPDVYYLSPDRHHIVRYNITDELGDGVGAIRDTTEILDWLINDLGDEFMSKDEIEHLLSSLPSK